MYMYVPLGRYVCMYVYLMYVMYVVIAIIIVIVVVIVIVISSIAISAQASVGKGLAHRIHCLPMDNTEWIVVSSDSDVDGGTSSVLHSQSAAPVLPPAIKKDISATVKVTVKVIMKDPEDTGKRPHPQPEETSASASTSSTVTWKWGQEDSLKTKGLNRWQYLVELARYKRRWSLRMTAMKYKKHGMPKDLHGPPTGFGKHVGRWQWREVRHFW